MRSRLATRLWPPNSITVRLVLSYALWSLAVIAAAGGLFYGGLESRFQAQQDDQLLLDYLETLSLFTDAPTQSLSASRRLAAERAAEDDENEQYAVYVRMLDANGRTIIETHGMSHA